MKIDQVRFLTAEIINILEHMHSKGISHRDLKPSNLLLDEEYHLKLIDFGTAKIKDKDSPKRIQKFSKNYHQMMTMIS